MILIIVLFVMPIIDTRKHPTQLPDAVGSKSEVKDVRLSLD